MRYFPIFVDLKGRRVVVVGGGEEATRKIRLLLKTEAVIEVIAAELHPELAANDRIRWAAKAFDAALLEGAALVYSADKDLNPTVSAAAQARGIPVNAVDEADISTFIVPSIVDRDPVVVAIGTEGTAPVLAQGIRARIDGMLPRASASLPSAPSHCATRWPHSFPRATAAAPSGRNSSSAVHAPPSKVATKWLSTSPSTTPSSAKESLPRAVSRLWVPPRRSRTTHPQGAS